jgi:hypothetical protein
MVLEKIAAPKSGLLRAATVMGLINCLSKKPHD